MKRALLVLALVLLLIMAFAGAALAEPPVHANNDGDIDFDHPPGDGGPWGHCFGHDAVSAARSAGTATHANYAGGVKAFAAAHPDFCSEEPLPQ